MNPVWSRLYRAARKSGLPGAFQRVHVAHLFSQVSGKTDFTLIPHEILHRAGVSIA